MPAQSLVVVLLTGVELNVWLNGADAPVAASRDQPAWPGLIAGAGTVLNFYKSPEEFMAPLKDESSAAYRNGLRLVDERPREVPLPRTRTVTRRLSPPD